MKKQFQFKLIEGKFEPLEAGKVLYSLIKTKVNYHSLEKYGSEFKFNRDFQHSKRRKETLIEASDYVRILIKEAEEKDLELLINGIIQIEVRPKAKTDGAI